MIEVEHLWKSFGPLTVLKGVSLKVETAEVICIIGPSGSGKSTLLRCINFLEQPDRGVIRINGEVAYYDSDGDRKVFHKKAKIAGVRSRLGMVFQEFKPLSAPYGAGECHRSADSRAPHEA
jgi:ABC-type histidine transport system ATPase subunit